MWYLILNFYRGLLDHSTNSLKLTLTVIILLITNFFMQYLVGTGVN